MIIGDWDFSKIPNEERKSVAKAIHAQNVNYLKKIHNDYEVSPHTYCCGGEVVALLNYFKEANDEGFFERGEG